MYLETASGVLLLCPREVYYRWLGGNLWGYRSADRYVGISYSMNKKRLDIYIDESGNFAPYYRQNSIYSVSFVFMESSGNVEEQKRLFKNKISKNAGGQYFVHIATLCVANRLMKGCRGKSVKSSFTAFSCLLRSRSKVQNICFYLRKQIGELYGKVY